MYYLKSITFYSALIFIIDLLMVWGFIYFILRLMRNNEKAGQLFNGFIVIITARYLASWIGLKLIERFLAEFMNWGFLFIAILFTPEIRTALENVGKKTQFNRSTKLLESEKTQFINELTESVTIFSNTYTGALITIQMRDSLKDYALRGITLDAITTKELLGNIFYPKTPLHDGAVIIEGNKIIAASVFFPSTTSQVLSSYGARHRAALAISELSDSITIIVSEETGGISIARYGKIINVTKSELYDYLNDELISEESHKKRNVFKEIMNDVDNSKKTNQKYIKNEVLDNGEHIQIYYRKNGGNTYEK